MELRVLVGDIADALKAIDSARVPFKQFRPGVGPYGEPNLVKLLAATLNKTARYRDLVRVMRTPDLLIEGLWAIEFKIARPFGDNGKNAENWSVNLLHPYPGNASLLGDCLKLRAASRPERKAVIAIGYEHEPPQVSLEPLWDAFEAIAAAVLKIELGPRTVAKRDGLIHPVHQRLMIVGWEVI